MRGPNFVVLWVIVSCLWTLATGLRIHRVSVSNIGRPAVLGSAFTWIDLLMPPLVFAIVLWGISRVAAARDRWGD